MSVHIRIRPDGPYLIEGDFTLIDESGREIQPVKNKLCRCG